MTQEELWRLRRQIVLNSLYYSDYINSFGIDRHLVCDFFDGYLDFLEDEMRENIPDYDGKHFFDHLKSYDNSDNLWAWYGCFEEDPLPLPAEDLEEIA